MISTVPASYLIGGKRKTNNQSAYNQGSRQKQNGIDGFITGDERHGSGTCAGHKQCGSGDNKLFFDRCGSDGKGVTVHNDEKSQLEGKDQGAQSGCSLKILMKSGQDTSRVSPHNRNMKLKETCPDDVKKMMKGSSGMSGQRSMYRPR